MKQQGMKAEETKKLSPEDKHIIKVINPFAEELFDSLGAKEGYVLITTNHDGIIIDIKGTREDIEKANDRNLSCGRDMTQTHAGANAIGLALQDEKPIQVHGNAHELQSLKGLTCSATPFFDANDEVLGCICLTGSLNQFTTHTYALVIATAKAIETRLHNSAIQQQLFDAQQYAFSIINHLSFGLIAFDHHGEIFWVNDTACRSLNIRRLKLINRTVALIYPEWREIKKHVETGEKLLDFEADLNTKSGSDRYLLNAYSIQNQLEDNIGYVITFRPLSRMLQLVNKYAGVQLGFTFDKIIYKSKAMQKLVDYAKTIANTPSTVLITGESGTGKEVFAQAIHSASDRRNNGFMAINCGAISSSLIESELFGYEEGAFTGANKSGRPGKIEVADKGTLFLDEIGEMPLDMQVKLLRALQEKTITRVGSHKEIKVDIRVIAATNKSLEEEVKAGNFRQDLYYRLNVIPLHISPLRERKMDIPPLFQNFLTRKASALDRPIPKIDNKTIKKLVNYSWPGNVRELENFAEKTVILDAQAIDVLMPDGSSNSSSDCNSIVQFTDIEKLPKLDEIEKQVIEQYMETFNNNISKTSKALGIGRNTLYQKIERYGISIE